MIKENKEYFLYIIGIILLTITSILILSFLVNSNDKNCEFFGLQCFFENLMRKEKIYSKEPEMKIDTNKDYYAVISTSEGDIVIDLFEKEAPHTVNNFVFLANEKYYDGVKIHRVIRDFLIQTGDRNTLDKDKENDGKGNPGYTFKDEINWESLEFSNAKREQLTRLGFSSIEGITSRHLGQKSVAMANSGPNTNGSQFFIVTAESDDPKVIKLDGQHTVFGIVVEGWNVVEKIQSVEVDNPNSDSPRPVADIVIKSVKIEVK